MTKIQYSKRKHIEAIEETESPQALIVTVGHQEIVSALSKILTTRGCHVITISGGEPTNGKYNYIFQFNNFSLVQNLYHKNLSEHGKFLFIEEEGSNLEMYKGLTADNIKILRVGDVSLWHITELTDKILKTIFSKSSPAVSDVRKKSAVGRHPEFISGSKWIPKQDGYQTVTRRVRDDKKSVRDSMPPPPPQLMLRRAGPPAFQLVTKRRTGRNKLVILTIILLGILLASGGYIFWSALTLNKTIADLKKDFSGSNWREADLDIQKAQQQFGQLKNIYDLFWDVLFPLRETQLVKDMGVLLAVVNNLLTASGDFVSTYKEVAENRSAVSDAFEILPEVLTKSEKKIVALKQTVADSEKRIDSLSFPYLPKEEILHILNSIQTKLTLVTDLLPIGKQLFFSDQAKTYLVLFQNNMELRPTGGFIGSFALLTVKDGRVLDNKIMDVYTADGQLKGYVEPPIPIRKYLSQPNWFLRDSNFDPDFAKSAAQASWFIQKELGKNVDGVIATNLFFVGNLLSLTGPVTLSDFNSEVVTSDNFFFKAQFYAQNDFFPGSTQKRDFLTAVTNTIQLRLTNQQDLPLLSLLTVVKNSLDEKNLLVWSSEEPVQKLIEEKGWGGRVVAVECVGMIEMCKADYLSVVEANLGVNKANYFVTKSVAIEKKVTREGNLSTTVTLSYENRNIGGLFSGGSYVNYLRFLLPTAAKFMGLTLNSMPITLSDIDIQLYSNDKTSYGYLLKLAPENKASVKITYQLPSFFTDYLGSYQFFFQKQAGDKVSPLVLSIILPEGIRMEPLNFKSTSSRDNELYFTTDTSVDRIFALKKE